MSTFTPKITKARFSLSPFTPEQMLGLGNVLATSIIDRIRSGKNVGDQDAKPLKQPDPGATAARLNLPANRYYGYPASKSRRGIAPLRNWTWTGQTLRSLKVLSVNENGGKIGFTTDRANKIATHLNRQEKAFGISPNDRQVLNTALGKLLREGSVVELKKVA